jgi:hypothetical protein
MSAVRQIAIVGDLRGPYPGLVEAGLEISCNSAVSRPE